MDSNGIALAIGAAGVLLGVARLTVSILSYRLEHRANQHERDRNKPKTPKPDADAPTR